MGISVRQIVDYRLAAITDTSPVDNSAYTWFEIPGVPRICKIRQVSFAFAVKDVGDTSVSVMLAEDNAGAKYLLNPGLTALTQTLAATTVPPTIQIPLDIFYMGQKGWSEDSDATGVSPHTTYTLYLGIKTNSAGSSTIRDLLVRLFFDKNVYSE
jgi:hypothetical protein